MIYWLVRFVNNYRQYVILTILILLSLLLLSLNNSREITTLRKSSFIFYGLVNYLKSPLEEFFYYKNENKALIHENSDLIKQLLELKEFKREKDELYDLLNFKNNNQTNYITAKIILKSNAISGNKFIINKGRKDNLKLNAIVFNSKGLIGYISDITDNYSAVHTIENLNVRISVKNERTGALGILSWDGEKFKVYNVNKSEDVKEGDIFVTSEYSLQFPPGIPVIKVTYASRESDILFYDITGNAISELTNVKYCLIGETQEDISKLNFSLKK